MDKRTALIKAIKQNNKGAIQAILKENAGVQLLFFSAAANGFISGSDGKTYHLEQIEQMAEDSNSLAFIPVEALTDEQLEKYQLLNQ